jgi:pyruvate ferredoxin oxidoreductase alpha subunit
MIPSQVREADVYASEELLTGCHAVSQGVRLADVDVIAAYPIRPYTEVMDLISRIIADGQLEAEYTIADSEHSQFEIVKHASSVGARAFAGSSGTGWLYGFEALAVTATDRGAFGVEHNDALSVRDLGYLLCWVTTPQEALEHVLIGYRVAEDKRVQMPMALAMDGAFLTHSQHIVKLPSTEAARRFLPAYDLGDRQLHPDNPISIAPQVNEDWVMEMRRQNWEAARRAPEVIAEAYREFDATFGTDYSSSPFFTEFMTEDAEVALIGLGTVAAPARTAARRMREDGHKVGYVGLRWFRPFPTVQLRECLRRFKAVGVIDRDFANGSPDDGGVLLHEVRSCLYPAKERPAVINLLTGLGGRDVSIADCQKMFELTEQAASAETLDGFVTWIGVRE